MAIQFILYTAIALLFTHELDAMLAQEWLVLPLTSWLPADLGKSVFVYFHIPLFAGLLFGLAHQNPKVRMRTQWGLMLFVVIHSILHALFSHHSQYHFHGFHSQLFIFLPAALGLLWLLNHHRVIKLTSSDD